MTENIVGGRVDRGPSRSQVNDTAWGLALVTTLSVILLFKALQIIYALAPAVPPAPAEFVPEVVTAQGVTKFPELRPQVQAYVAGLLMIFGGSALLLFGPACLVASLRAAMAKIGRCGRRSPFLLLLAFVALYLLERRKIGYGLFDMIGVGYMALAILALIAIVVLRWAGFLRHQLATIALWTGGTFVVAICAAGFLRAPNLAEQGYESYSMIQFHYTAVMGTADQIGHGLRLWQDVVPFYGILLPAILGAWIKFVSAVSWAAHYRIAQILSVAMIVSVPAILLIMRRTRSSRMFGPIVLPMLFVVPFLYPAYHMMWFPNQTGWRFIGLSIALLTVAAISMRRLRPAAVWLGVMAGLQILYSTELGLIVFGASALFLVQDRRAGAITSMVAPLAAFATSAAATIAGASLLYFVAFGHSPLGVTTADLARMYQIISSPWFSFELHDIDILALVIWLCASVILFRGVMLWREGPLAPRTRFDMFVATIIVLWFSYYVKRPQTLNLWSNAFLFAFLLPSFLDARRLGGLRPRLFARPAFAMLVPVVVVALLLQNNTNAAKASIAFLTKQYDGPPISGIATRPDIAASLRAQTDFLRDFGSKHRVAYATNNSFSVPIESGIYQRLPARSFFWNSLLQVQLENLARRIDDERPEYVLIDIATSNGELAYGGKALQGFNDRLLALLPNYRLSGPDQSSWRLYKRD